MSIEKLNISATAGCRDFKSVSVDRSQTHHISYPIEVSDSSGYEGIAEIFCAEIINNMLFNGKSLPRIEYTAEYIGGRYHFKAHSFLGSGQKLVSLFSILGCEPERLKNIFDRNRPKNEAIAEFILLSNELSGIDLSAYFYYTFVFDSIVLNPNRSLDNMFLVSRKNGYRIASIINNSKALYSDIYGPNFTASEAGRKTAYQPFGNKQVGIIKKLYPEYKCALYFHDCVKSLRKIFNSFPTKSRFVDCAFYYLKAGVKYSSMKGYIELI